MNPSTNATAPEIGPYLYLPIEVSARELDAKLLMAAFAVKRGFEVVLGQKWLMQRNTGAMPPGIMLFKTLTTRDARAMKQARDCGHRIAAIDEEVPGMVTRVEGLRWVFEGAVKEADVIFAVGEEHNGTLLRRFPEYAEKYEVVGNPRWDLLRPEFIKSHAEKVAEIKQKFGPFILINTNLGLTNNAKGSAEQVVRTLERGGKFDRRRPADAAFLAEAHRLEQANFEGLKQLLPRLSQRFPDRRIIVRPHPNEKVETWQKIAAAIPRTVTVQQGSAVPWILAADVLLHTYCTTGVEAFALGRPAVCFIPTRSPVLENYLSPQINFVAESTDEVIERVAEILDTPPDAFAYPSEYHATFQRSFESWTGAFAASRIVDSLICRFDVPLAPQAASASWNPRRSYAAAMRKKSHQSRVMPEMTCNELLWRLRQISTNIDDAPDFKVHSCGDRLFHVHGNAEGQMQVTDIARAPWTIRLWRWLSQAARQVRSARSIG